MAINTNTIRLKGARLLCNKVRPVGTAKDAKSEGGLFLPEQSTRARASYGVRATVLSVGPKVIDPDLRPGVEIIMDEFGGRPIFDEGRELPLWLVGESEVMVVLDETS